MAGYAERKKSLPRFDSNGYDYGKRRTILVKCGEKYVLYEDGQKGEAVKPGARYSLNFGRVLLFPVEGEPGRQKEIAKQRMYRGTWADIAPVMFDHLGCKFPVALLDTQRTVVIDDCEEYPWPPFMADANSAASNSQTTWVGQKPSVNSNNASQEVITDILAVAEYLVVEAKKKLDAARANEEVALMEYVQAEVNLTMANLQKGTK